jgi:hypothetical protein
VSTFKIATADGTAAQAPPRCISVDLSGLARNTSSTSGNCP